ncbi:MAG: cupin domain-containing protein [bacterium]
MRATTKKLAATTEFTTAEHCHIHELSSGADDKALSIARARVEPGVTTQWHRLNDVSERYCIISGKGRMELEGLEPAEVTAGDVVLIPAGVQQRITNTGETDLLFFCVCLPRFSADCYEDTEPGPA